MVGVDPESGDIGATVEEQTRCAIANLAEALKEHDADLSDLVSVRAYLARRDDYVAFNAVYQELIPSPRPTRTTVGATLMDPAFLVEVDGVAGVMAR